MMQYFSDREKGPTTPIKEEITSPIWGGIVTTIERYIKNGFFSEAFPENCMDNPHAVVGTSIESMGLILESEIPELIVTERINIGWEEGEDIQYRKTGWPLRANSMPPTLVILDLIEFCHKYISEPTKRQSHSYYAHEHLSNFDKESGQSSFRDNINIIFSRNGISYELKQDGCIKRLTPPVLRETLREVTFKTGDEVLDRLLENARSKFFSPDPETRKDSLDKLWDAWERLKTTQIPGKKNLSTTVLIEKASSEPEFRARLQKEAKALTDIGNDFHIRHSEVGKIQIDSMEHVDYLFHRLFAMIYLLLRKE